MAPKKLIPVSYTHLNIQDKQGRIQVYVKRDDIGAEEYQWFKKYDIGDILGIEGRVFKTNTGEISIHATKVVLLSKSIQVLPDKWAGCLLYTSFQ